MGQDTIDKRWPQDGPRWPQDGPRRGSRKKGSGPWGPHWVPLRPPEGDRHGTPRAFIDYVGDPRPPWTPLEGDLRKDGFVESSLQMLRLARSHNIIFLQCRSGHHRSWTLARLGESWAPFFGLAHAKACGN